MSHAPSQEDTEAMVRGILAAWSPLQHAVRSGFGGPDSAEKRDWLVYACACYLRSNRDLSAQEVEEYLCDYVDSELHLLLQDGSVCAVACDLVECFDLLQQGRSEQLQARMLAFDTVLPVEQGLAQMTVDDPASSDDDQCQSSPRVQERVVDEDGWETVVSRRRRR